MVAYTVGTPVDARAYGIWGWDRGRWRTGHVTFGLAITEHTFPHPGFRVRLMGLLPIVWFDVTDDRPRGAGGRASFEEGGTFFALERDYGRTQDTVTQRDTQHF